MPIATGMPASTSCGACSICSSTNALDRSGVQARLARPHIVDVGAAFGHVLGKRAARVDALGLERPAGSTPKAERLPM